MNKIQYTIRNIPPAVDQVIRKRADQEGISFNQMVVDLLSRQVFGTALPPKDTHFDWLFKQKTLDTKFDSAIQELSEPDRMLFE